MSLSDSDPPEPSGGTGKRALKVNKACVPCRARKIKCDAAVTGIPCSSCTSRQCVKDCVLPIRKGRTRKSKPIVMTSLPASDNHQLLNLDQSKPPYRSGLLIKLNESTISDSIDCESPRQTKPDLLYLNILNEAVDESTGSGRTHAPSDRPYLSGQEDKFAPRNSPWNKLPLLDDLTNEFLVKKGVFDLPPRRHLDALIKAYFDHVHPFAAVINRDSFVRGYQTGDCSLFLLRAILAPASINVPIEVLSACGFASRSVAQESFFSKAKLLDDFAAEKDPLLMLQGYIVLTSVILDHPSDRDFCYWLHNGIRLATQLDIRNTCIRGDKSPKVLKLYRRIWWSLYTLDIFYVFANTKRSRLLEDTPTIKPRTEVDWEVEDVLETSFGLLSPVSPGQMALPVVYCELSRMFGQCLSTATNKPHQDPREMLQPLDAWRKALGDKMHVDEKTGTDVYYLSATSLSYRYECVLCRLIRRSWKQYQPVDWVEWARQRLRSAIMELDTVAVKVLASGTLHAFPIHFVTTMTALLALHIESALDPAETDVVRSMARISISHIMLLLNQGREIPAVKRALPIFEEILTKKNLGLVLPNIPGQASAPLQPQENTMMTDVEILPHTRVGNMMPSQMEQCENLPLLDGNFFGQEFLDDWDIGQLDFIGRC